MGARKGLPRKHRHRTLHESAVSLVRRGKFFGYILVGALEMMIRDLVLTKGVVKPGQRKMKPGPCNCRDEGVCAEHSHSVDQRPHELQIPGCDQTGPGIRAEICGARKIRQCSSLSPGTNSLAENLSSKYGT